MINPIKNECSGCGVCKASCPVNAIEMVRDDYGFSYPITNKNVCIDCHICEKVCRFREDGSIHRKGFPIKAYIARSKDDRILRKSSSGGMFSIISDHIINHGGIVYGATFSDEFFVVHDRAMSASERDKMCGSKYVQSDLLKIYDSICSDLHENKYVGFFGTPCQCVAIDSFLKQKRVDTNKLLMVDLICHGVMSPKIWNDYLNFVKEKYEIGEIKKINFRDKKYGSGYNMSIIGTKSIYHKADTTDPFIKLFTRNLGIRISCFNCPMKRMDRESDITIGDFQKSEMYFPEFADGKGNSAVLLNSEKGMDVFEKCAFDLYYKEASIEQADQINLRKGVPYPKVGNKFYRDYSRLSFEDLLKKYTEYGTKLRIYAEMRRTASRTVKPILNKLKGSNKG